MPRDCSPVEGVLDSQTCQKTAVLFVRAGTINLTGKKGIGHARQLAFTVPFTVRNPNAGVFRGVTDYDEEGDEDWLIYAAVPPHAYDLRTGESRAPWKEEVFLVFVDEDGIIRWWDWTKTDPLNPRRPIDHNNGRFLETLL